MESLNSFIESTCVIVVFAYLMTRNPLIALLSRETSRPRHILTLGGIFGLAGLVELYFVQDRFPYDTYALIVTFAALRCGWQIGLVTASIIALGCTVFLHAAPLGRTILFVATAFCAGVGMRFVLSHISWGRGSIARLITSSVIAIVIADLGAVVIRQLITDPEAVPFSLPVAILRLCADGLGIILLQLILNDALTRTTSERFQVEAARSRTLLAETKLLALRARIHPHFLFNTLTTIAALCRIDAGKAESATVQLAQIMRRALELDKRTLQPLGDEVEYVRDYVEIEKLRLGNRLNFVWEIEPRSETAQIPPFILQILVENAVQHGIVPKMGQGNIIVRSRAREKYILIAVQDDGVGIPRKQRTKLLSSTTEMTERTHGIGLANEQLELLYGTTARLRLFSRENCGTLVAFRIPVELSFATLQQSPLVLSRLLSPSSLKGENLTV